MKNINEDWGILCSGAQLLSSPPVGVSALVRVAPSLEATPRYILSLFIFTGRNHLFLLMPCIFFMFEDATNRSPLDSSLKINGVALEAFPHKQLVSTLSWH